MTRTRFLLSFLALLAIAMGVWVLFRETPQQAALQTRELATRGLAEYLASRFPGQRALVISNPFTEQSGLAEGIYAQEQAGIRGLKEGFGQKVTLEAVAFPELKPAAQQDPHVIETDPSSPTPLSYLVAEDAFDKLLKAHPDCELAVSLIGLPAALDRVEAWGKTSRVRFALLFPDLRLIGDAAAIREAVRNGKLAACVLPKPNAPSEQASAREDFEAEFERRFLLVTPDTLEQVLETYPRLF